MPVASLAEDSRTVEGMLSYQSSIHIKDVYRKYKAL